MTTYAICVFASLISNYMGYMLVLSLGGKIFDYVLFKLFVKKEAELIKTW